jgi:DNA-binding MarR family transcriptional regulator
MAHRDNLAAELANLTLVVNGIIRQEFNASAGARGGTFAQFRMLHAVKNGIRHVGKLSDRFGISQPAASVMVDALVADRLLRRVPHSEDRRRIELHLTPKAAAKIDAIYKRAYATIDGRLSKLPKAKKKSLATSLGEVVALLSADVV